MVYVRLGISIATSYTNSIIIIVLLHFYQSKLSIKILTGTEMANPLCCVFWFIVLLFISFIVAFFCAPLYILCSVISACISPCGVRILNTDIMSASSHIHFQELADFLLKGLQFPKYCAVKMVNCEGF